MRLHLHEKIADLSPDERTLLAECNAGEGLQKYPMRPPSMLRVAIMAPNLALGCVALFLAAFLLIGDQPWLAALFTAIGVVIELVFGAPGVVALYRRQRLDRYYLYLHPQGLVERLGSRVTMIPAGRLVRATEASTGNLRHHGVIFRDQLDTEKLYVWKTWYATENNQPQDLVEPINAFYRLHEHKLKSEK